MRQAPSMKKKSREEFRLSGQTSKVTHFICFPDFFGKKQHFNVSYGNLVYCFRGELFLGGQN